MHVKQSIFCIYLIIANPYLVKEKKKYVSDSNNGQSEYPSKGKKLF